MILHRYKNSIFLRIVLVFLFAENGSYLFAQDFSTLTTYLPKQISNIKISSDAKFLYTTDVDNVLTIWDVNSKEVKKTIKSHNRNIFDLALSHDNQKIATGSGDGKIYIYDKNGVVLQSIETGSYVKALQFCKDDNCLISAQWDGTLKFWNVKSGTLNQSLNAHSGFVWNLDISYENGFCVTTGFDDEIKFWDINDYSLIKSIKSNLTHAASCLIIPNSKRIALLSKDNSIKILDWELDKEINVLKDDSSIIKSIATNQSGELIFTSHSNGDIKVWNINTGECLKIFKFSSKNETNVNLTAFDYSEVSNRFFVSIENGGLLYSNNNNLLPLKYVLLNQIKKQYSVWLKKDEFEKNSEFLNRISDKNKEMKIVEIGEIIIKDYAKDLFLDNKFSLGDYDAETEIFRVTSSNFGEIALKVPLKDAPKFKQEFVKSYILNPIFGFDGSQIRMSKLTFKFLDKTYYFDNSTLTVYQPYDFKIDLLVDENQSQPMKKSLPKAVAQKNKTTGFSPVDIDIPEFQNSNENAIAIVIGNKDYINTQNVDFALNDARIMKKYLIKSMGFREGNVLLYENISLDEFNTLFGSPNSTSSKLQSLVKNQNQDVFIYYSGHGAPGLKDSKGYFVPVGCDPNFVENGGYSLDLFYKKLSQLNARSINVVIDACFSGANILKNISPIGIKIVEPTLLVDNLSVITSSSESEISSWYSEMRHGMFTYFFLKSIQEYSKTDFNSDKLLTMNEIFMRLSEPSNGVNYHARLLNGQQQTPNLLGTNGNNALINYYKK